MRFDIITIFPKMFDSYFREGILSRALGFKKKIQIYIHDLRDFTTDRHRTVDDRPYGGGAGMILKPEPLMKAIVFLRSKSRKKKVKVILFSAKGKLYTQSMARSLTTQEQLILICGRYEGIDERVLNFVDEEISIGEYILTGGEIPAMIMIDSVARLLPGVLGCEASNQDESFTTRSMREYPHYTRPETLQLPKQYEKYLMRAKKQRINFSVPSVLLSGNHSNIQEWRKAHTQSLDG